MDDYIGRQTAEDALGNAIPSLTTPDGAGEYDHEIQIAAEAFVDAMQIIHDLPAADVVEPICCQNCIYAERPGKANPGCKKHYGLGEWNDYCSRGQGKE